MDNTVREGVPLIAISSPDGSGDEVYNEGYIVVTSYSTEAIKWSRVNAEGLKQHNALVGSDYAELEYRFMTEHGFILGDYMQVVNSRFGKLMPEHVQDIYRTLAALKFRCSYDGVNIDMRRSVKKDMYLHLYNSHRDFGLHGEAKREYNARLSGAVNFAKFLHHKGIVRFQARFVSASGEAEPLKAGTIERRYEVEYPRKTGKNRYMELLAAHGLSPTGRTPQNAWEQLLDNVQHDVVRNTLATIRATPEDQLNCGCEIKILGMDEASVFSGQQISAALKKAMEGTPWHLVESADASMLQRDEDGRKTPMRVPPSHHREMEEFSKHQQRRADAIRKREYNARALANANSQVSAFNLNGTETPSGRLQPWRM